ncbi:MAG TPA: diguanylate cyclase, partial [Candidatus Limnocylindrales bacterium]
AAEHSVFDTDHRELCAALMTEWGLPETLVAAAYHCEAPDEGGFPDGSRYHVLTLSLHFARALAGICVADETERWGMLPELYAKAARLGITPDELTVLADDVVARWRAWGSTLEVDTHDLPPFADLLSSVPPQPQQVCAPPHRLAVVIGPNEEETARLKAMIEAAGYAAFRVANGIDGLMVVLRDSPELIVVDLDCPDLDGPAFCRAFRDSPLAREAYLVLVGDREQEPRLSQGVDAGADDYLVRPVSEEMLRVRLRTADKIVHLRDEIRRERRGLMRSAHEWAGSQRRMMQAALTDPLTQLPNRRHGLDFLAAEWVFARANNVPLACLMVDIDHFKAVNDRHGHDAGDAVLAG